MTATPSDSLVSGPMPGVGESGCGAQHCITCGDDGDPMVILAIDDGRSLALCAGADGQHWSVEVALVAPVVVGERLLVHAGTAIARLTPEIEAR